MLLRTLIGAALAAIIAIAARRTRSLTPDGALAAVVTGTLAAAAGWAWAILLIVYFVSSTALSHLGRREKEQRTAKVVAKGGERDALQVFANGAVFIAGALLTIIEPNTRWLALGIGALAASAADTWATEIGTLYGGGPRSIVTFRPVAAGMSGGVTAIGLIASAAGAGFIAILARVFGAHGDAIAIAAGGFVGALVDSLLGALIQTRRWCPACAQLTERIIHDCGTPTTARGGVRWLTNDAVNLLSGVAGGLLAAWMAR
ncbi:MAG TPA: DUF92 domain-containing protein [Gemmatimonadaceae bacterium]|nr:DUF92 domain-containing protein [Gemmatimonadaceae bacterium]